MLVDIYGGSFYRVIYYLVWTRSVAFMAAQAASWLEEEMVMKSMKQRSFQLAQGHFLGRQSGCHLFYHVKPAGGSLLATQNTKYLGWEQPNV